MAKINVYSSSASNAIKVFDASSTGLKPDNAILVTTGTEPSNAIQINVGEKKWSSIAVNFGGSEPGPTPPGPTPPGPTPFPYSTVVIGDDEWTSENISWDDNGEGIYKKENVVINGVNYGTVYFYNAEAALRLFNNIEEIYPGWHIATKDDVDTLITEVNEDNSSLRTTTGWNDDMNGTDSNGFHAEPLGNIYKEDDYEEWNYVGDSYDLWMNNLVEGNPDFDCVEYLNKDNNFYIEWDIDDYNSYYPIRLVKNKSSDKHKITIKPSTNGSVSATPSEGNPGTTVTLSNTPNNYYSFEKYNITGATLTGNSFEIGDSDVDVQGVFVADQYNVSYTNDGHGSLTGTLTTATGGMTTTLTATPNTHYNLNNITVTGGTVNGNVLTVTSNCTANASYVPKQYTVTYKTNGNGTLTGGVTTATGNSTTTLTATPNTHYSFSNYSVTGGTINGNTLTITANCTAKANFTMIQPYTLTLQQQTGGTIGANKNTGYNGDTVTLSNTASQNYEFASYSITGATLTGSNFKFGNGNVTAKANFNSIAPAKTFVFSSNRAYNVSATAGNRTGWDNLYKLTPSSYNALDFIYAVDYKFKLTGSKRNAKFEAGIEFGGNYYNWNSRAKRWEGDSWERYNVMYNAQSSLNTGMFPIIRSIGAQESSAFKNFGCENDNNGLYYLNTATDWTNSEVHLKYLGRQKHKNPVSAYMPLRSSFVSSFNPSTNVCLTSGVYGMQYWYVDYMWVYGGFYSGTSNNLKSYPGSSCVTVGLFSTADQAKAYKWLKSM